MQEQVGNGVILLGSTGEALSLPLHIKKEVVAFVSALQLKVPLFVGVPGTSLYEAKEWLKWCSDYSVDGFLITSPIYSKPGLKGQILWFESLLNQVSKPVILYNIPSRAGSPLYVETVQALADHPTCFGVKDSGGDLSLTADYVSVANHLQVYCGDDALWPKMHHHGAVGLISVLSNAWPLAAHVYVHNECFHYQDNTAWMECLSWLTQSTNPIAIKAILKCKGLIQTSQLKLPLTQEDLKFRHEINRVIQKMDLWEESLQNVAL